MKLQAEIDGRKYEVEIRRENETMRALIDGEPFDAEITQPEPNVFLINHKGRIIETFVEPNSKSSSTKNVWIKGREHIIRMTDPKRLRGSETTADHERGPAEIRSAMPGKVVRVLTEAGSPIEKGQGVLVVEAMKMQNELKSPKSGAVKAINVSTGETVSAGDVLATIE